MAAELTWKRSSYSGGGNANCVECAGDGRAVWVRDSKDRGGRTLEVPLTVWRAFVVFACS